jgi:hypothetical protein
MAVEIVNHSTCVWLPLQVDFGIYLRIVILSSLMPLLLSSSLLFLEITQCSVH